MGTHRKNMAQHITGQDWAPVGWSKKIISSDEQKAIQVAKSVAGPAKKSAALDHATEAMKLDTAAPLELRAKIMQARIAKHMTQAQLAKILNAQQRDIAAYEAGKAMPTGAVLSKMSKALGVNLSAKAAKKPAAKKASARAA